MQWLYGLDRMHRVGSAALRMDLIARAIELGASGFDVAPMYGNGAGECALGTYLKAKPSVRNRVLVNTKFGIPYVSYGAWPRIVFPFCRVGEMLVKRVVRSGSWRDYSAHSVFKSVDKSLQRLGTDYIDTLFIHEPLTIIEPIDEICAAVEKLRSDGKIRNIGVAGEYFCVFQIANFISADVVQAPLEMLKVAHGFDGELIAYHVRRGLAVQAGQGLLLDDYYAAARSAGAETVLFQSTKLAHLKEFAGA